MTPLLSATRSKSCLFKELTVNQNFVVELIVFVLILLALNFFFHLHISIIGSLVLTILFAFVFRRSRSAANGGS